MKESEKRVLALANRDNNNQIRPDNATFGKPIPTQGRGYNTHIVITARPTDPRYSQQQVLNYNRLNAALEGVSGSIEYPALDELDINLSICKALLAVLDVPTQPDEYILRYTLKPNNRTYVCVVEFRDHPLIFGILGVSLKLGYTWLDKILHNTKLSGFTPDDLVEHRKQLADVITRTKLSGFNYDDITLEP